MKNSKGKALLSEKDIKELERNRKSFLDSKPISHFEEKILAVISNPEEVKDLEDWNSKATGIWRAIQDPLSSTVNANLSLFE